MVLAAVGVALLITALVIAPRLRGGDAASYTSRNRDESALKDPLWPVPHFRVESSRGAQTSSDELKGHVWIANFIFTTCTNLCPMMSSKLVLLQRALPDPALRFVSISVDPEHDTAAALSDYAKRWNGGDPRWLLLRPTPQQLSSIAHDMHVPCEPTTDPDNPMMHSGLFFLIDKQLQVRAVYDPDEPEALAQIRRDIARLSDGNSGSKTPTKTEVAASASVGEQIYLQLGCNGCHYSPRIAPKLDALWGKEVTLSDGSKRTADEAYVRESIVKPGVQLVQGYSALMPSYADRLSATELESLISYLRTRGQACDAGCAPSVPVTSAADPLCHMNVVITPETPRAERDGKTYYFCSEHCRASFQKSPESTQPHH